MSLKMSVADVKHPQSRFYENLISHDGLLDDINKVSCADSTGVMGNAS